MIKTLFKRRFLLAIVLVALAVGVGAWLAGSVALQQVAAPTPRQASAPKPTFDLPGPPDLATEDAGPDAPRVAAAEPVKAPAAGAAPGSTPDDVAAREEQLKQLAERSSRKEDSMIAAWEVAMRRPIKVSTVPLTPPNWSIVGVVQRGTVPEVIVQRSDDPKPYFKKIGDVLPGGARIAWVKAGAVGLVLPKRQLVAVSLD